MLLDFKQIKQGPQLLSNIQQLRTDPDNLPIDYMETVNVSGTFVSATLSRTPTTDPVTMVVNNLVYTENQDFTVNRSTKVLTWTATDLTITEAVATSIKIRFKTLDRTGLEPEADPNVYGMILVQSGGDRLERFVEMYGGAAGTWVRVDKNLNPVAFDASSHGTWANMRTLTLDSGDHVVEIPTTWVKTEVISGGTYDGKTCYWIADGPKTGFHVHPAFMKTGGTPGTLRIGAYETSKGTDGVPMSVDKGTVNEYDSYWYYQRSDDNEFDKEDLYAAVLAKNTAAGDTSWRAYSIYDHHFLARMMLVEAGTTDVHDVATANADERYSAGPNALFDYASRDDYRGIWEPCGGDDSIETLYLDGLNTVGGTYHVLAANGSGTVVDTGASCLNETYGFCPASCLTTTGGGVDFGDLFIAAVKSGNGAFADVQEIKSGIEAFSANGTGYDGVGPWGLKPINDDEYRNIKWRLVQVV